MRRNNNAGGAPRRRPTEFRLPDGRKVVVARLPEDAETLRRRYSSTAPNNNNNNNKESTPAAAAAAAAADEEAAAADNNEEEQIDVEVVLHGSDEHRRLLREAQAHHAARRAELRARFGAAAVDELDSARAELDALERQLDRLQVDVSVRVGNASFSRFGFDAKLRMYDDDDDRDDGDGEGSGGSDGYSVPVSRSPSFAAGDSDGTPGGGGGGGGDTIKLFKRPVVKQYFHGGLLWRAANQTEVMSFELFFDLLYVGIIAINGDHAAEEANGHELLRFAVTFAMSWKIWSDVQQLVSWFETNDVAQRVEMLVLIACLLGQTTNMLQAFAPDPAEDTFTQLVGFYLAARLFSAAYCALTAYLVPLVRGMMAAQVAGVLVGAALWIASVHVYTQGQGQGQGQTEQQPPDGGESHGDESPHGGDAEFPRQRVGLVFAALAVDLVLSSAAPVWFFTWARKRTAAREEDTPPLARRINRFFEFFPAINIEHRVERTNAFVTLVLGYSVVGVVFQNAAGGDSSAVLNAFLGKAVLGLVQAYVFNWLYFEVDGGGLRTHAIRRSVVSASLWQYSHLAFIMAYILAAAALSKLVVVADCANAPLDALTEFYQERSAPSVSLGLRLYYCVGLGTALLAMGAISLSHEHRGPATGGARCRLPKWARLANRGAVCVVFFCLSAATGLDSLGLVATTTGLSAWTLLFELWAKSCPSDSLFVGGCTEYTARCGRRTLHEATRSDGKVDIAGLGRAEKTAVLDHV